MLKKKLQIKQKRIEKKNENPETDPVFMDMNKVLDDSKKADKKDKEIEKSALKKILDHLQKDLEK